mgnify:CR=1 FL=1
MSWVIAGMAGLGVLQGAANQKKMERHNKYRAEAIKYSPWTGMGDPGEMNLPDAMQMGLQGAATGAALGNIGGGGGSPGAMGATTTSMNTATPELYNPYMMMQA